MVTKVFKKVGFFVVVACVFMSMSIPVFASATNDFEIMTSGVGKIYMTYSSDVPANDNLYNSTQPSYNLYDIPLQFSMYRGSSNTTSVNYYTGWIYTKVTLTMNKSGLSWYFTIDNIADSCNISIENITSSGNTVTLSLFMSFDNLWTPRMSSIGTISMHARYNTNALSDTLSISSVSVSSQISQLSQTTTPSTNGSLVQSIAQAINQSTDIDAILGLLTSLDNDLLNQVVPELDNMNGILSNVYSRLGNVNDNIVQEVNALRQLVLALSGVAYNSGSNLADATYDRWVALIQEAIGQEPDSSDSDVSAGNVSDGIGSMNSAEDNVYQEADLAMDEIQFNLVAPSSITASALVVSNYLTQIFNASGATFQYLIYATLTVGLIISVVGIINSYHGKGGSSSGGRSQSKTKDETTE